MKDNILITVCGRAGSSGFKNKNLKTFLGCPLVYYTLSAGYLFVEQVGADVHVDICLNTDSPELANIVGDKYPDVTYIERPKELGEGSVPKAAVWRHSLNYMQANKSVAYDYIVDLDITSPLRRAFDVLNCYQLKVDRKDADMVESVCNSRRNPYFNMVKMNGDYVTTVIDSSFTTRQQAPTIYDENASIYVLNTGFFNRHTDNMLNQAKTVAYVMKDTAVLDIDSEEDFLMMQVIAEHLYSTDDDFKKIYDHIRR